MWVLCVVGVSGEVTLHAEGGKAENRTFQVQKLIQLEQKNPQEKKKAIEF